MLLLYLEKEVVVLFFVR